MEIPISLLALAVAATPTLPPNTETLQAVLKNNHHKVVSTLRFPEEKCLPSELMVPIPKTTATGCLTATAPLKNLPPKTDAFQEPTEVSFIAFQKQNRSLKSSSIRVLSIQFPSQENTAPSCFSGYRTGTVEIQKHQITVCFQTP